MYDLAAHPNEYMKAYFRALGVPPERGGIMAASERLCSSLQTGDSESNPASSSRALIRRPPGLPAGVWSSGLSFAALIPSQEKKSALIIC